MLNLEELSNKKRFKWLSDEEVEYLESNFPWCGSRQEAVYCLKHDIISQPKCQYKDCSENATFTRKGYNKGCCKAHNIKLHNLEKYGVENVKQVKQFKDKAMKTYNSKSDEEKAEIQKRKEKTMMKKYGTTNPSYVDEIKNKISKKNKANATSRMKKLKKNNQKKYGVDNVFQLEEVKEKMKKTFLKKYGVENPSQSDEIKLKKEETCVKRFGVAYPMQHNCIYEKQQKYRWKNYTLPSGKVIKVQGFENIALDILLETYSENDLVLERKNIPKIKYGKNNRHVYTTDIYIPKENKFIEVKSEYTLCKYLETNLLKEAASVNAGFNFEFMILDKDGNIQDKDEVISDYLSEFH